MRKTVFLPVKLIKEASEENWLRSLGYFVRMKSLHANNTHYNFTLRNLSERLGCSPACLSFHLKILTSKNLISYSGRNITFKGFKKLQEMFYYKNIGVPVDSKNQYDILRGQLIRFNLSKQQFKIQQSGGHYKSNNFVPFTFAEKSGSSYTGLSTKGLGNVLGLSKESGSRIRRKLTKLGLLECNRVFSMLHKNASLQKFYDLRRLGLIPFYSMYRNGNIIVQRRMEIQYIPLNEVLGGLKLLS